MRRVSDNEVLSGAAFPIWSGGEYVCRVRVFVGGLARMRGWRDLGGGEGEEEEGEEEDREHWRDKGVIFGRTIDGNRRCRIKFLRVGGKCQVLCGRDTILEST